MSRRSILPTIPIPVAFLPFDTAVDDWFENHLRHRKGWDALMYSASSVGDHGAVWLTLAGVQARRRGKEWQKPFLRACVGLGLESALVNGPVKLMFRRTRPVHDGPRPLHLRQPRTSSFPSGHATAAFFGAALLRDDDPYWPLYYALAVVVAASRVHVRIHHASDVIGGVAIGVLLGELVRHLFPLDPPPIPPPAADGSAATRRRGCRNSTSWWEEAATRPRRRS
jgi:undecaprenyl-diphosphatase